MIRLMTWLTRNEIQKNVGGTHVSVKEDVYKFAMETLGLSVNQECIPVGCVPPTCNRTVVGGGVSLTETPLDRDPPPPDRDPLLDRDHPPPREQNHRQV